MDVIFIDILTSSVLALIMFGVGLSLSVRNFFTVIARPKAIILGLFLQMVILPILAFIMCYYFNISNEFKVGIIILAACPGGTTSNYITYLLNNNTTLAIVLTVFNSFISLFSIPLIVHFALQFFMQKSFLINLPMSELVLQIFLIVIVPVILGVVIHEKNERFTQRLNSIIRLPLLGREINFNALKLITMALLAGVFSIKLIGNSAIGGVGLETNDFVELLPIGILLNLLGLFVGYLIPLLLQFKNRTALTISIQVGLQNTTLAFLVAFSIIGNNEMQKPAIIYAFFSFWTTVGFGLLGRLVLRKKQD